MIHSTVEILRLAWDSLLAHKLRGTLTILGIVIGISSVVAMVSLIEGLNRKVGDELATLGSDVIRVSRFSLMVQLNDTLPDSLRNRPYFNEEDAEAIRQSAPSVLAVTGSLTSRAAVRGLGKEATPVSVEGVDEQYFVVHPVNLEEGRFPTSRELRNGEFVAVVGDAIAEDMFPGLEAVGQKLHIGSHRFMIVGRLPKRGGLLGGSQDNRVMVPRVYLERYFFGPEPPMLLRAKPVRPGLMPQALKEIEEALRRSRGLSNNQDNNFALRTSEDLMALWNQLTAAIFVVMVTLASVALLVGGIGVMNIMLVSVTERTREIGLRKALGANRRQILGQFLAEAVVLTGAGGVLGSLLGLSLGWVVQAVSPLPAHVPFWAFAAAVTMACGVGLFFGLWPAVRASRLAPVDALRYE